jgi:hypothetical protein
MPAHCARVLIDPSGTGTVTWARGDIGTVSCSRCDGYGNVVRAGLPVACGACKGEGLVLGVVVDLAPVGSGTWRPDPPGVLRLPLVGLEDVADAYAAIDLDDFVEARGA